MFDSDRWSEIWNTLSRNKLRSFLTMFGVGWGIFMLVVMLGMGNGLQQRGVLGGFDGWATNSCFIWTMPTSMPYAGFQTGRYFNFDNERHRSDHPPQVPGVEHLLHHACNWAAGRVATT